MTCLNIQFSKQSNDWLSFQAKLTYPKYYIADAEHYCLLFFFLTLCSFFVLYNLFPLLSFFLTFISSSSSLSLPLYFCSFWFSPPTLHAYITWIHFYAHHSCVFQGFSEVLLALQPMELQSSGGTCYTKCQATTVYTLHPHMFLHWKGWSCINTLKAWAYIVVPWTKEKLVVVRKNHILYVTMPYKNFLPLLS